MSYKALKNMKVGEKVKLDDPDSVGKITKLEPSKMFRANGGCFVLGLEVVEGPNKGEVLKEQYVPGNLLVEVVL